MFIELLIIIIGRMPCVELADAIVQTARETLENAIRVVEGTKEWNAKVVYPSFSLSFSRYLVIIMINNRYGDTDSLFVHLPGASREQAFKIGNEIAAKVTSLNPSPVKLQFEKVYHPCVLV